MKELNDAIAHIRKAMIAAHREAWGREDPLSMDEMTTLDSRIEEQTEDIVNLWMKSHVAKALGVSHFIQPAPTEEAE